MDRGTLSAAQLSLLPYRALIDSIGVEPRELIDQEQFAAWLAACNQWLSYHARRERLVPSPAGRKSSALQYERRIVEHGEVETRDDRHDSMNALVWLQYPQAKLALSTLHINESSRSVDAARRGPRRDAATLFDEHGLVVLARNQRCLALLQNRQWANAWLLEREDFAQHTQLVVFGHALLERLANPYKGLTGHAMLLLWPHHDWPSAMQLDALLAANITALAAPRDLLACPVMGWPGYAANQDLAYYADRNVFRPASSSALRERIKAVTHHP